MSRSRQLAIGLILGAAITAAHVLSAANVRAEEHLIEYEAVMHVRSSEAFNVLDEASHSVGTARFRGLAILPGGEIAVHRYEGWFDLVEGSGKFHGYAQWTFDDGSELKAAYDGEAAMTASSSTDVSATFRDFTGAGRFQNVSGSGSFSGRRLDDFEHGGSTYIKGRLVLDVK